MSRLVSRPASRLAMFALSCSWAALLGACVSEEPVDLLAEDAEDGFVVEDGKADDFLSLKAREFVVTGKARVVVEEGRTISRARNLLHHKHTAITWFLNQYLVDKETGEHGDANYGYGGFAAMVKDGAYEDSTLVQVNATTYEFSFKQVIAGRRDLMSKLPLGSNNEFSIEIGKPTNAEMEANEEWYREPPWDGWNPANVPASQKETLTLRIEPETASSDGWWDYAKLLEDGKLQIDAHFGFDYSPDQMHINDSKALYDWLKGRGFNSPVSSFANLTPSSTLTKTISAGGRNVRVEVRIVYPKPGASTDPDTDAGGKELEKHMLGSLQDREVVVFSGHSGSLYGFALANWKKTDEGDLDDSELAVAQLSSNYQIVFAEGCNTYMLGNTMLNNPSKNGANLDVITTTNFSVSYSPVQDFLGRLLELDSQSRLRPRTMTQTIADLDAYTNYGHHPTLYGIHGIDDNPKVHPFANLENLCEPCSNNAACGGVGNACVTVGNSGKRCVAACTDDSGCGEGYECKQVASASSATIYGSYCVPETRTCE